jgi:hypothetical protein
VAIKKRTTTCPCRLARWNVVPEIRGKVKSGAGEARLVVEEPVVSVLVVLETLLAGTVVLVVACTRAKNPTRSASVTARTMRRGSTLRRGGRGVERDALCGVSGEGGNAYAIVVSFPQLSIFCAGKAL